MFLNIKDYGGEYSGMFCRAADGRPSISLRHTLLKGKSRKEPIGSHAVEQARRYKPSRLLAFYRKS